MDIFEVHREQPIYTLETKEMNTIKKRLLALMLGIIPGSLLAVTSSESTAISVNPSIYIFKAVPVNSETNSAEIAVKNVSASALAVGTLSLSGDHADQYQIDTDACSNTSIAANSQCLVTVKYAPTSRGHKQALLNIPSDAADTPILQMFLSSREDNYTQSSRRLPPVLYRVNIPETMTAGQAYTLEWSILGYHDDYTSIVAMFDCTGKVEGSCGNTYNENFFTSGSIAIASDKVPTNWRNDTVYANEFKFSVNFTPLVADFTQETDIVVRFYRKNIDDQLAGNGSLSLLVPGNLSSEYYDKEGRRIKKKILP